MKIDRYKMSRGPAEIAYTTGGQTAYYLSVGDVNLDAGFTTKDLDSAAFGTVKTIRAGTKPVLSFAPLGMWRDLLITFPHASMVKGRTLVGALVDPDGAGPNPPAMVDNVIVVRPLDTNQKQTTLYGVALSKVPDVVFSDVNPLFSGDINFTVCGKNNVELDADNRVLLRAANTLDHPHYDPATLLTQPYAVTCAILNGGQSMATKDGVKLSFNLAVTEYAADGLVYDVAFNGLKPTASFQPLGLSEDDFLDALHLQGPNSLIGQDVATNGADLIISGTGVYAKLPLAGITKASLVYGQGEKIGSLDMVAGVAVDNQGVPLPRFVLGVAP